MAKYIQVSLLMVLISCTCVAAYVSFTETELLKWFSLSAFLVGATASLHLGALLLSGLAFSKLEITHVALFTVYSSVMACSLVIPGIVHENWTWKFKVALTCYGLELVPLLAVTVALYLKDNQSVQHWLHPIQELVDGYPKSSISVPMKEVAPLQQVLIQDSSTQNISPKPSQVFKTWPKGPPFPVKALYSFKTATESELPFRRGDELTVLDCRGKWWHAEKDDRKGFIPSNYVQVLLKAEITESCTPESEDEAAVEVGNIVEVMERYDEKCLIRNCGGKIGAIATSKLKFPDCDDVQDKENIENAENTNIGVK